MPSWLVWRPARRRSCPIVPSSPRAGRFRDRTALRLRQQTERTVFRTIRQEQSAQKLLHLEDSDYVAEYQQRPWPAARPTAVHRPRAPRDVARAVSLLVEHAGHLLDGEMFELLTATQICGRRIPAYLDKAHPDLPPEESRRVYQRVKRRHSRALARLRPALANIRCPHFEDDLLCLSRKASESEEQTRR